MTTENNVTPKIMVLGIGGEGAEILKQLAEMPEMKGYTLALIDTERKQIATTPVADKICAGSEWGFSNMGCGGDVERGRQAFAKERSNITKLLTGVSSLIVCGGLGGGTATGGVSILCSVLRTLNIPSVFLFTTPFSFESYPRRSNAEKCAKDLLDLTDALFLFPNDLLFSTIAPDTPVEQAFELATLEMASVVSSTACIISSKNVFGADYASLAASVRGKVSRCRLGTGTANETDGNERCSVALGRMLHSPFLGGFDDLNKMDAFYLVLIGGQDLEIAEMKRAIELAADALPKQVEIISGVSILPEMNGKIRLTGLALKYAESFDAPPVASASHKGKKASASQGNTGSSKRANDGKMGDYTQVELFLSEYKKGIFNDAAPNLYGDIDLDIPTFQRKNIKIDLGKSYR